MDLVTITNWNMKGKPLCNFIWNDHKVEEAIIIFLNNNSSFTNWEFVDNEIRHHGLDVVIEWKVEKIQVI